MRDGPGPRTMDAACPLLLSTVQVLCLVLSTWSEEEEKEEEFLGFNTRVA